MSERKIGQFTARDFDNDLQEGRGKMSPDERAALEAMIRENRAKADEIIRRKREADAGRASAPESEDDKGH